MALLLQETVNSFMHSLQAIHGQVQLFFVFRECLNSEIYCNANIMFLLFETSLSNINEYLNEYLLNSVYKMTFLYDLIIAKVKTTEKVY